MFPKPHSRNSRSLPWLKLPPLTSSTKLWPPLNWATDPAAKPVAQVCIKSLTAHAAMLLLPRLEHYALWPLRSVVGEIDHPMKRETLSVSENGKHVKGLPPASCIQCLVDW